MEVQETVPAGHHGGEEFRRKRSRAPGVLSDFSERAFVT